MSEHQETFNEGMEYFHNAIAFAKSNRFGMEITYNVIALSAEYLLGSILKKYNIQSIDGSLSEITHTLKTYGNIPTDIVSEAQKISSQCTVCSARINEYSTDELIMALKNIKRWCKKEINT